MVAFVNFVDFGVFVAAVNSKYQVVPLPAVISIIIST